MRRKRKIVGLRNGRVKEHFFFFFNYGGCLTACGQEGRAVM